MLPCNRCCYLVDYRNRLSKLPQSFGLAPTFHEARLVTKKNKWVWYFHGVTEPVSRGWRSLGWAAPESVPSLHLKPLAPGGPVGKAGPEPRVGMAFSRQHGPSRPHRHVRMYRHRAGGCKGAVGRLGINLASSSPEQQGESGLKGRFPSGFPCFRFFKSAP